VRCAACSGVSSRSTILLWLTGQSIFDETRLLLLASGRLRWPDERYPLRREAES
jgi:hypothetical protein